MECFATESREKKNHKQAINHRTQKPKKITAKIEENTE